MSSESYICREIQSYTTIYMRRKKFDWGGTTINNERIKNIFHAWKKCRRCLYRLDFKFTLVKMQEKNTFVVKCIYICIGILCIGVRCVVRTNNCANVSSGYVKPSDSSGSISGILPPSSPFIREMDPFPGKKISSYSQGIARFCSSWHFSQECQMMNFYGLGKG